MEIVGEPGIGKSRLVAELLAGVLDVRVLSGVCGEYESSTSYFPFRSLLRSALSLDADAAPEATAERLREVVTTAAPHLVPWLSLLGIPLDLTLPPTRAVSDLDEQFRKARLEDSVDELAARVLTSPTVVLFEDAQLMDDASAELVAVSRKALKGGRGGRAGYDQVRQGHRRGAHGDEHQAAAAPRPEGLRTCAHAASSVGDSNPGDDRCWTGSPSMVTMGGSPSTATERLQLSRAVVPEPAARRSRHPRERPRR